MLIPALDLLDSQAVRLVNGRLEQKCLYDIDPVDWVKQWTALGAKTLHIVNLSAAFRGTLTTEDLQLLRQMRQSTPLVLEYGGGIRTLKDAEQILSLGYHVVLGSMLLTRPKDALKLVQTYGERIIAGIDAKDGYVATHGWTKQANISAFDLIANLKSQGFKRFIFTDIAKDGTLSAPNFEALKQLKSIGGIHLTASGGVSSISDLTELKAQKIDAVIVGKALLDGLIDPLQALAVSHA